MTNSVQQRQARSAGFSLVELLVVMALTMIVTMAIVGIYRTSQHTAVSSDQTVELQQNLRFALDQMGRDIRMAGFLVDKGTLTPIVSAPAATVNADIDDCTDLGDTCFTLRTGTDTGRVARLTGVAGNFVVAATQEMADLFAVNDRVRLVRPADKSLIGAEAQVISKNALQIELTAGTAALSSPGDMLVRIPAGAAYPRTISYFLFDAVNGDACATGENCELRRLVSDGNSELVASGFDFLSLSYILKSGAETAAPAAASLADIVAVRVSISGATRGIDPSNPPKRRAITELVALKNL